MTTQDKNKSVTAREREVADLCAAGLSNQQIAERLGIAKATVEVHLYNTFRKLGVRSRTQLAVLVRNQAEQQHPVECDCHECQSALGE